MKDSQSVDNPKLKIRNAYPQDATAIAAMLVMLCKHEDTPIPFSAVQYASRIRSLIEQPQVSYHFLLAECDSRPVGFISYYYGYDLSSLSQGAHIGDLYVREPFRDKKIGTMLLASVAENVLKQSGEWISLTALRSNELAHAFYQKRGAADVPVRFYAWGQKGLKNLVKTAR